MGKVDAPRKVSEDGEEDVDPKVSDTSSLEEDSERREDDSDAVTLSVHFIHSLIDKNKNKNRRHT